MSKNHRLTILIVSIILIFAGILTAVIIYGPIVIRSNLNLPDYTNGSVTVQLATEENNVPSQVQQETAKIILNNRLERMGVMGAQFTVNAETITIDVPRKEDQSVSDISDIFNKITSVSYFTVQEIDNGKVDDKANYLPTGRIIIESMDIVDSDVIKSNNALAVSIQLTDSAGQEFERATASNIGKPLAIFMDENFISAPTVQAKISGGAFTIHGFKDVEEAKLFNLLLLSGRLPCKFEIRDIR